MCVVEVEEFSPPVFLDDVKWCRILKKWRNGGVVKVWPVKNSKHALAQVRAMARGGF